MLIMLAPMIRETPAAIEKNAVAEGMSRMMGREVKGTLQHGPCFKQMVKLCLLQELSKVRRGSRVSIDKLSSLVITPLLFLPKYLLR